MAEDTSRGDYISNEAGVGEAAIAANPSRLMAIAAAVFGALVGTFEIANTSVGWHLASGRWILDHRTFLRSDPFSFTSGGAPWIDHEWLFQVGAALMNGLGGAPALVVARALTIGLLTLLLFLIAKRSGLSSAAALVFALICTVCARPRFFLRPELVTLVVVPAALWLFLERDGPLSKKWLLWLAALMVVGANAHGGALVVPVLLGGILAAESVQMVLARHWRGEYFLSGISGVLVSVIALAANPYGWHLYAVPFKLGHLVDQSHIPNPEWISPTFSQAPVLFLAIALAILVMGLGERRAARWILLIMASALALRHIRNLGLFFVLLPLAAAPALASWRALRKATGALNSHHRANLLALAAAAVLAVSVALSPQPRFGFGFAENYFPAAACDFLDREGLPTAELYNDVLFGGYLIDRYAPSRLVFQDDRNEIHQDLLREIWEIFQRSDLRAWSDLLSRYEADTALVRYHPPLEVTTPDGRALGERGFSALWFPREEWALVFFDDRAMVFVRRAGAAAILLESHEYAILQPDDMTQVARRLAEEPLLIARAAEEAARAQGASPNSNRANEISHFLAGLPRPPVPVPVPETPRQQTANGDSDRDQ